jgi:protein-S-isoprenylcysteine O-methyltransferase Ste14
MNENIYRMMAAAIFFTGIGISSYFRRRADRASGKTVTRRADGAPMMIAILLGGMLLWLSPLAYLVNPQWMAWSKIGLPEWTRWLGVALGAACVWMVYWLFSSIGDNITATSATRSEHRLVTRGPYRWVWHPLYTMGSSLFVSIGIVADNWFIAALGLLAFILMAARTPREEANLIEKFGDEYREYMKRTGRFLPKIGSFSL